jgi:predicted DNA-binding transcriptional regulator AlpA
LPAAAACTIDQVTQLTGISKKTIYGLRCQTTKGSFAPAMKVGGRLVWDPDELDAWLATRKA